MIPIASNLNSLIYLNVLTPENPAVTAGGEVHPTAQSLAGPKKKKPLFTRVLYVKAWLLQDSFTKQTL